MGAPRITYNPGILGDEELVRSFVVRRESLKLILETLRENAAAVGSSRHLLIVGPRGSGKTMLVRRVAAEIRGNSEYGGVWFPLVFAEESYPVSTAGEFWLEALFHLADQTGEPRWERAFHELRQERDEPRLRERALGQLLDFADEQGKRLLLVVENLNALLGEQMSADAAWDLRHTLAHERRLMLLATATSCFKEITNADQAWFEMFVPHELRPLDKRQVRTLWRAVTGETPLSGPLQAVRILTGGSPRLLTILAAFATNRSFRDLMEQLVHLIDDHTEYFKGHLDTLGPKERKVFVALLDHWDPAGSTQLAGLTRLSVNEVSVWLSRLESRGAVDVVERKGRRKIYQVSERLYNIYYLMRRRGHPSGRVRAAVQFMVMYYGEEELVQRVSELAREACSLPVGARGDHYFAYGGVVEAARSLAPRIIGCTIREFFKAPDAPDFIRRLPQAAGETNTGARLHDEIRNLCRAGRVDEAEAHLRTFDASNGGHASAWNELGIGFAAGPQRYPDAERAFRTAIGLEPSFAGYWQNLGRALEQQRKLTEAASAYRKAVELDKQDACAWHRLADVLVHLKRLDESEQAARNATELQPKHARAWLTLGHVLLRMGREQKAEEALRQAIKLDPKQGNIWAELGHVLGHLGRPEEEEQAYRQAVELSPKASWIWHNLAVSRCNRGEFDKADQAFLRALELNPRDPESAAGLLHLRASMGHAKDSLLRDARSLSENSGHDPEIVTEVARFIAEEDMAQGFEEAEIWSREALKKSPNWRKSETLAWVLGAKERWKDALDAVRPVLDAAATDRGAQRAALEFLIRAAARHDARAALVELTASSGISALEPLAVGLRIFIGESPTVAKEIFEIGKDVADRIRRLASGSTTSDGSDVSAHED